MYRSGFQTNLAGQLFVRTIEIEPSERKLAYFEPDDTFLNMPFTEAIEYFKRRFPDESDKVDELLAAYVRSGDKNTRLLKKYLAEHTQARLLATLEEGGDFRSFAQSVAQGSADLGIEPPSHGYLSTVFRTQVHSAYGAGRFEQITNDVVIQAKPFVEYRTAGDSSVRDSHKKLDGLQFSSSSKVWHKIAPPNGFNCRCSVVTLDESDMIPSRVRKRVPLGGEPDAGFDGPPKA